MTQQESKTGRAEKSSPPNLMPPELIAMGKKRIEELAEMQTELLEKLQEANRSWLERMQTESRLASEFSAKLTGARSIPETATVCQEWASRRMEMATEDAKHLLADTQKFMETGVRLLSNGWLSNGSSGSS
jgi:Phasin protein